jgi:DNA-binding transcriptional MerR regulator
MAKTKAPKTITLVKKKPALTKAQIETLRSLQFSMAEIRRKLYHLEDESDSLSKVMFNVGMVFKIADQTEDALTNLIEEIDEVDHEITF